MIPLLQALLAAMLFGLSTPLSKGLLQQWSAQQLAGLLYLGAAMGAFIPILIKGRKSFSLHLNRANGFRILGAILFGGILGPNFLMLGLESASASSVSLWLNLEMVTTALLGVFLFKDHLGKLGMLGAVCVLMAGIILSWGEGAAGLKTGMFLALACICWGIDNNLTALIDGLLPLQSTFWKGLAAGSFNLALGLWLAPHAVPTHPVIAAIPALVTGIFSYGASIVLYVTAAQSFGATRSQMVFATAPIFGLLGAFVWLGEPLTLHHLAALVFQAAGIFLLFRDKHGHEHAHEAMSHTHAHTHDDGHHNHAHAGEPLSLRHSHPHNHEPITHAHPHWPDIHHRHVHRNQTG